MVLAGTRWLGIRLDLLSALLVGAVALLAALYSQNDGEEVVYIALFFLVLSAHLKTNKIPYVKYWRGKKWSPAIVLDNFGFTFLFKITM